MRAIKTTKRALRAGTLALTAGTGALLAAPFLLTSDARAQVIGGEPTVIRWVRLQDSTPGVPQDGHIAITGTLLAGTVGVQAFRLGTGAGQGLVLTSDADGNGSWQPLPLYWLAIGNNIFNLNPGNVGIGTMTPQAKLDVNGSLRTVQFTLRTGPIQGAVLVSDANGNGSWQLPAFVLSGANAVASFAGNLGIGTSSPVAKLDLRQTSSTQGALAVSQTGEEVAATITTNASTEPGLLVTSTAGDAARFETTADRAAVIGYVNNPGINATGGFFQVEADGGFGVQAFARRGPDDFGIGVLGVGPNNALGYGVFSDGPLGATGTKSFVIDHPLDPANRFLRHYSAEGPEPYNVYSGSVTTDERGFATVVLPEYFPLVSRDPRVQLTVVDDSDRFPLAKVTAPPRGNRFTIRTSEPRVTVYWEVKAVRDDAGVRRQGVSAEPLKPPAWRGRFLQPELHGRPAREAIFASPTGPISRRP